MTGGNRALPLALLGAVLVAGCGGGGTTPLDVAQSKAQSFSDLSAEVAGDGTTANPGLSHTSIANMPTQGSAQFNGYAGVLIARSGNLNPSAVLVGDASVTADFDTSTLTGHADNFYGARTSAATGDAIEPISAVSGTLALNNGCIGATACGGGITNPYEVSGQVDGNLSGGGHSYAISTPVIGEIRGNPAPKGIVLAGSGAGQMDGVTYDTVVVTIVGKTP